MEAIAVQKVRENRGAVEAGRGVEANKAEGAREAGYQEESLSAFTDGDGLVEQSGAGGGAQAALRRREDRETPTRQALG